MALVLVKLYERYLRVHKAAEADEK